MNQADWVTVIATVSSAAAALAALGTLVVAFLTFREGRKTITELGKLTKEAAEETAAQHAMVASMRDLVNASSITATILHAVFLEAHSAHEVDGLLRVRVALAEVAYATQRVMVEQHPQILFYGARQTLRAALAGVAEAEQVLPIASAIGIGTLTHARQDELMADREIEDALKAARDRLTALSREVSEQLARSRGGQTA